MLSLPAVDLRRIEYDANFLSDTNRNLVLSALPQIKEAIENMRNIIQDAQGRSLQDHEFAKIKELSTKIEVKYRICLDLINKRI